MQEHSNDRCLVVAYERVSTEQQDLTRQEVQRERAAADYPEHELRVIADDGVSAFKVPIFDRPGGRELCRLIESGEVAAVYADAQDRLSRGDDLEWVSFRTLCEAHGTRIVIDGRELGNDLGGRLEGYLRALIARQESVDKSHRVSGGFRTAAKQGRRPGSKTNFGYRSTGSGEDRVFTIDPTEAEVVRRIFTEYLAGRGFGSIAKGLNADGLRTHAGVSWNARTISKMVANPFYTGLVRHKNETFEGQHPAIIDRETFERASALRAARSTGPGRGRGRHALRHLLGGGLLRCGRCGGAMSARGGRSDNYRCAKRTACGDCDQPDVSRRKIDGPVLALFLNGRHDYQETIEQASSEARRQVEETAALVADAEAQAVRAVAKVERFDRDYGEGKIDGERYSRLVTAAEEERDAALAAADRLRARLADAEAALEGIDGEEGVARVIERLRETVAGELSDADTVEAARAALTSLFESFTVETNDDGGLRITPKLRKRTERQGRRKAPLPVAGNRPNGFG